MSIYLLSLVILNLNQVQTDNNGTVKFFNNTKGFGFIKNEATGEDIFVHVSGLRDEIRENDRVTFDIENGKKGVNAINVSLAR